MGCFNGGLSMKKITLDNVVIKIDYLIMLFYIILIAYPFYYVIVLSFNDGMDAARGGIYFWPRVFTLENYKIFLKDKVVFVAFVNSVLRTIIGILSALLVTGFYAYAISKKELLFRKFYVLFGIITMYFGGGLIPTFLIMRSLGLFNNFLVYILPSMFSMFNAILFTSFFKEIPAEIEESAFIDGANEFQIFFKLIFPISKPVFAAIALFNGVSHWNSWFDTMLYTSGTKLETLSHLLVKKLNISVQLIEMAKTDLGVGGSKLLGLTSNSLMLAVMVITAFPIIAIYPLLQKYFIKGIMIGSLKG
jgi:putative aldouronate transport system permease protein